jgi:hypothetical protein
VSDIELDKAPLKVTRPGSRWRNRYFVFKHYVSWSGIDYYPGEQWGISEWPSCDTAETYGRECETRAPEFVKYLGAFPVEAA